MTCALRREDVVDASQGAPADGHREWPSVVSICAPIRPRARRSGPSGARERLVARDRELLAELAGEDLGEQPDERSRIAAVERRPRSRRAAEALPDDAQRVVAVLVDVDPSARTTAIVDSVSADRRSR